MISVTHQLDIDAIYCYMMISDIQAVFNFPSRLRMFRGAFEGADRSTWFRRCVGWLRCGQKSPERLWEHDKESHKQWRT